MEALRGLGVLLALYGVYSMTKGQVYASHDVEMRYLYKDEKPVQFGLCVSAMSSAVP